MKKLLILITIVCMMATITWAADAPANNKYEAEAALLENGCFFGNNHTGFSGSGFVSMVKWSGDTPDTALDKISFFFVDGGKGGTVPLTICYDNGHAYSQMLTLYVNGQRVQRTELKVVQEGAWNVWGRETFNVQMYPGKNNTVALMFDNEDDLMGFNLDYIETPKYVPTQSITLEKGQTLVPLRNFYEKLGGTVTWNGNDRTIDISYSTAKIKYKADSATMELNGQTIYMEENSVIVDGHTLVPVDSIREAIGGNITETENGTVFEF